MTAASSNPLAGMLRRQRVAEIIGVAPRTISDCLNASKPGGRYEHRPFPAPHGYLDAAAPDGWVPADQGRPGLIPFWTPDQLDDLHAWRDATPRRNRTPR